MSQPSLKNQIEPGVPTPGIPTKEELIDHLDFEIGRISNAHQRDGWTKWALYGVIASSGWLLLDQVTADTINLRLVFLLVLAYTLGLDLLRQLRRFLPYRRNRYQKKLRFQSLTERSSPAATFLHLIRHLFILALAILFARHVSLVQATGVVAYYLFYGVSALVVIPFLYYKKHDLEVVRPTEDKGSVFGYYAFWALAVSALAWGFWGYLNAGNQYYSEGVPITNYRAAALVIVLVYCSFLLMELGHKLPLLSRLTAIRRELIFGHMDLNAAAKSAEIALLGLGVDETLQGDISDILPILEIRTASLAMIGEQLSKLEAEVPDNPNNIDEECVHNADALLVCCRNELDELLSRRNAEDGLVWKLRLHTIQASDLNLESVKAADEVLRRVADLDDEITKKAEQILVTVASVTGRLTLAKKIHGNNSSSKAED